MINLDGKGGTRPVVVYTRQNVLEYLNNVIVKVVLALELENCMHKI
jgi:hypothetical protein